MGCCQRRVSLWALAPKASGCWVPWVTSFDGCPLRRYACCARRGNAAEPEIRFCTSADGTRIAYAAVGEGPPLVFVPVWGGNVELNWRYPESRAFPESLAQARLFVSFDHRGVGASQRDVDDLSLEAQVADIAAVVDHLQLERFDLMGEVEGASIAVAYAAQHPERVSRLVLSTSYACGEEVIKPDAARTLVQLIRVDWSLARRAIADVAFPSGPIELQRLLSNAYRESASPEIAARYTEFYATVDVRGFLPQVKAPTLVLHSRRARAAPISAGRAVAALIPDARFVALEGDPAGSWSPEMSYIEAVARFLDEGRVAKPATAAPAIGDVHTILFTDMEGSTTLTERLGDAKAQELRRTHDSIVRDALKAQGGSETKHTGDGIMASFPSASRAIECAVAVQRAIAEQGETPLRVRIGLNAGEPVAEEADLFGTAVNLAKRICDQAEPGQILVSDVVQQLAAGKGFTFADKGEATLKGFEKPVRLHEVRWQD
jgi:class 3 adenylate cyclase/alpha-beta hydrolase superfamily lysophospholipase